MIEEFRKIENSKNPADFSNYISNYPKSEILQKAVDKRDSLDLFNAISKNSEDEIDRYLSSHQTSRFTGEAQKIKNEMAAAREMFTSAKNTNSIRSYEEFLVKYPKSLHNTEAHQRLVDVAETEALNSKSSRKMESYIKQYLIPNNEFLGSDKLSSKISTISSAIDKQLITENVTNDPQKAYAEYSALWKRSKEVESNIPSGYLRKLDQIIGLKPKMCDVLFTKLKEASTKDKQDQLLSSFASDFPDFKEDNLFVTTILKNISKSSGSMKVFNANYLSTYFNSNSSLNYHRNYTYKYNSHGALDNVEYEELNFEAGKLTGVNKSYQNGKIGLQLILSANTPKEIAYYQEGKLVETINFINDGDFYVYEFENGVNLTLKDLDQKIAEGNAYLKSGNYDMAISNFESARNNKFPSTIAQNIQLDKSIVSSKNQQAAFLKKEEQKRIQEEQKRLAALQQQEKLRKQEESKIYRVSETEFADNGNNYINKNISIRAWYSHADQRGAWGDIADMTLRMKTYPSSWESLYTAMYFAYSVDDNYYFRVVEIGGTDVKLKIPRSLSGSMPNTTSSYVIITGKVSSSSSIEVNSIKRE